MVHAEQISFGNNLPGYYVNKSASKKSAVIVIQVSSEAKMAG